MPLHASSADVRNVELPWTTIGTSSNMPDSDLLAIINANWRWTGLVAVEIIDSNAFGNVIVRADGGEYWRICPESLSCEVIATTSDEYFALTRDPDFQTDWQMHLLVEAAVAEHGPLAPETCFCLKMPAPFGGAYEAPNIGTISRQELLTFAGDIGEQINDVPDGATLQVVFKSRP